MGITERKEREKEEMRHKILDAARRLFLELGYEKTTIRGIADAIEYSPATIYLYYKDKNELLFALHEVAFIKMMQELSAISSIADPFEQLVAMGKQYIKFAIENPELYDLMFIMTAPMETLACRDELWEDGMKSFCLLQSVIEKNVGAGYFEANINIENLALTIWSYIHGLVTIYLKNRMSMFQDDNPITRIDSSFELFINMLKKMKP